MKYFLQSAFLVFLAILINVSVAKAQTITDTTDLFALSLTDLMNMRVTVASKVPLTVRESPGTLTIISEQDILNSGARDMIDVLRLVPGFDLGTDVQGIIGVGVRGNWAHEGKVLLLLDGMEMNELLFSTLQLGGHYCVNQIKRIEIIRGPGSAIYGGFAEYGVINIITKIGDGLDGVSASSTIGTNGSSFMRQNLSVSAGKKTENMHIGLSGFISESQQSDRTYTDFDGNSFDMEGQSGRKTLSFNGKLQYKHFNIKALYDEYKVQSRDMFGATTQKPYQNVFRSMYLETSYSWQLSSKLKLIPKLSYRNQTPWLLNEAIDVIDSINQTVAIYDKTVSRSLANLTAQYDYNDKINITFGAEAYADAAKSNDENSLFYDQQKTLNYSNLALFTQGFFQMPWANITIGARYDNHSLYDAVFVPRLGLTKASGKWHGKLLYTNAFRAPGIENISLSPDQNIQPEKTSVWEAELGYKATKNWILSANLFDISTQQPIYYAYEDDNEIYQNGKHTGTSGIEFESKLQANWGSFSINYSYYTASLHPRLETYEVAENRGFLLAFPKHKIALSSHFRISKDFSFNLSGNLLGTRYIMTSYDNEPEALNPALLLNANLRYENILTKGLSISLGTYNIGNVNAQFIQAYKGGHASIPTPRREFALRINYFL